MDDQDSHTKSVITFRQPGGKPSFSDAFGAGIFATLDAPAPQSRTIRPGLFAAALLEADPELSGDGTISNIRALSAMAECGHVTAGQELLALAVAVVENPRAEVNLALREWLGLVLRRLQANPKGAGVEAFAPRSAGEGRRPAYSDDLLARMRFEAIQFLGCTFALAAKATEQLKASAAFDRAAEMLTHSGFVDPRTSKPYTGAAVRGWFYSSGWSFDSQDGSIEISIQRTASIK